MQTPKQIFEDSEGFLVNKIPVANVSRKVF